uniref:Leucine-rich repeat-containing N-terminal plant-type domain-containing protein n=1 Tax=Rhizophora mucronata TaxID=61149 RepID=A0A2P2MR25_RHIMU
MDASDFGFVLRGVGDSMSWLLGTRENCSLANQAFLHSSISLCLRFLGTDADCCKWAGVWCNETTNRVTELVLWNSVDPGSGGWYLNASLFLPFKDLTSLDLYGNKILGCIENEGTLSTVLALFIS